MLSQTDKTQYHIVSSQGWSMWLCLKPHLLTDKLAASCNIQEDIIE